MNEDVAPEKQALAKVHFHEMLYPSIVDELEATLADFSILPGVVLDGDREEDIRSKAWKAMLTAARSWAADAIKAAKDKIHHDAPILTETKEAATPHSSEAFNAPDAANAIAAAATEKRIIHRKGDGAVN